MVRLLTFTILESRVYLWSHSVWEIVVGVFGVVAVMAIGAMRGSRSRMPHQSKDSESMGNRESSKD